MSFVSLWFGFFFSVVRVQQLEKFQLSVCLQCVLCRGAGELVSFADFQCVLVVLSL
jgi:hypothetical protein